MKMIREVIFRRMREGDAPSAARMEAACSREAWSAGAFVSAVRDENALYLVAEREGQLVGCCGIWQSLEEGDICNVAVEQSCRRKGIGEAMLTELMRLAKQRGVKDFTLEVRSGNEAAIRLYEKLGFQMEGIRKGFYSNPREDALILWKRSGL